MMKSMLDCIEEKWRNEMSICGECDNCGANNIAISMKEIMQNGYVDLVRVCGFCGYEQYAGSISMAQYNCAHRD